jgi:hypothetical protein
MGSPAKGVNLRVPRVRIPVFPPFIAQAIFRNILGPVAQGLEQSAHNRLVVGSNPTRPTI